MTLHFVTFDGGVVAVNEDGEVVDFSSVKARDAALAVLAEDVTIAVPHDTPDDDDLLIISEAIKTYEVGKAGHIDAALSTLPDALVSNEDDGILQI